MSYTCIILTNYDMFHNSNKIACAKFMRTGSKYQKLCETAHLVIYYIQCYYPRFRQVVKLSAAVRLHTDRAQNYLTFILHQKDRPGGFWYKRKGLFQPASWPVVSRPQLGGRVGFG